MELTLWNTLSGKKEKFEPLETGKVSMYVCGPTVYDYCHLGHARAYTAFDVIYRFLKHCYKNIRYVRNITDIDDKIIARASKEIPDYTKDPKAACLELTKKYTNAFHEDMDALHLLCPDAEPCATQNIEGILEIIAGLVKKGFAYEADGSVYFEVSKFHDYGCLSGRDSTETHSRIEKNEHKRSPADFVLWKKQLPEEPAWDSPFGPGRPGWHIECSAMTRTELGDEFDIHGGGQDLIFPHHENEICQSRAFSEKRFAKYWLHNGFITIHQEKMSKSLGNFKTIRDLFKVYRPMSLKLYLLSTQYRSPLDFDEHSIRAAEESLQRIENSLSQAILFFEKQPLALPPTDHHEEFDSALCDDFNTAKGIGILFSEVTQLNNALDNILKQKITEFFPIATHYQNIQYILKLLGILPSVPQIHSVPSKDWKENASSLLLIQEDKKKLNDNEISLLVSARAFSKSQKSFSLADSIRKFLSTQNIEIRDGREAHLWKKKHGGEGELRKLL